VVTIDDEPYDTAEWTADQIECLLKHRLQTHADKFIDGRKKEDIILGWNEVKLEFNLGMGINYSVEQLKSKFFGLKKIHAKHNAALQATGNVKLPEAPKHWEVLHSYFGDRQGLSGLSLGSSDSLFNTAIDDDIAAIGPLDENYSNFFDDTDADGLSDTSTKRPRLVSLSESSTSSSSPAPSSTQGRSKKTPKGKLDVGESLASLGSSFERGLLALASSLKPSGLSSSEVSALKDLLVQQEEAIRLGQKQQEELEGLNSSLGMLGDKMDNLADKIGDSVARALVGILGKK
jgi:hypothetical protein